MPVHFERRRAEQRLSSSCDGNTGAHATQPIEFRMTILHAFSGVITIFFIGFLGYILASRKLIGPETIAILPRFVTVIVLPPYLLRSATTTLTKEQVLDIFAKAGLPFLSIILTFCLAACLCRIMRVAPSRRGSFMVGFAISNAMNIGLPINIALFGEAAVPHALIYFLANTVIFWTLGCYCIARSGQGESITLFSRDTLKRIFSPPLTGFALGLLLVFLEVHLPAFLDKSFKYVGDLAIPLGTMYVGIMIGCFEKKDLAPDRDAIAVFLGRFLLSPLLILGLTWLIPVPPLMRNVFIVQASLPVMMTSAILAAYYKADTHYASLIVGVSTMASIITIPVLMALITLFLN